MNQSKYFPIICLVCLLLLLGLIEQSAAAANSLPNLLPAGPFKIYENKPFSFQLTATDADINDRLTFRSSRLPAGATLVDNGNRTATFSWTPNFDQAGVYKNIYFTVSDGTAGDTEYVYITVVNVNRPPVLDPIGNKTVNEEERLTFQVRATDPDSRDTIILSASNLPSGAAFVDQGGGAGLFDWTPARGAAAVYSGIVFKASNAGSRLSNAASDNETIAITVVDVTVPQINLISPHQNDVVAYISTVTISGTVDEPLVSFTVNGNQISLNPDLSFAHEVELSKGENVVSLVATDRGNHVVNTPLQIYYETAKPVAIVDTFDGETLVYFSWDVDGDVVYNRTVTTGEAYEGRRSMKVEYRKNIFAPYSFFAFSLQETARNIESYEELHVHVLNSEGGPLALLAKIESESGQAWESTQVLNLSQQWTELVFDLTTAPFSLNNVENILWLVNPGDTASSGIFYIDQVFLVNTDTAYRAVPLTSELSGPSEGFGEYLLTWTDASSSGGFLYRLEEANDETFSNPTIFYSTDVNQLIKSPNFTGNWYYRVSALSGVEDHSDTRMSAFSNIVAVNVVAGPPVIEIVDSFVGKDTDNVYASGSLVRINVLELYRANNVVSGTVRITSVSTGYDSGTQPLSFDSESDSWFYHWVTNDLPAADDYAIETTLTNDLGLTDTDGSGGDVDLTVSLTLEPPLIATLFEVEEFTVPAQGPDLTFVRTYKASSFFEGVMGRGWFHEYEISLELNQDSSAVVIDGPRGELFYLPNGQGGFTATKPNNFAELFSESTGYRLRFKDGTIYRFDEQGKLQTISDRNQNAFSFAYNEFDLLSAITDASNQTTTFGYTLFSGGTWRLTDITDPFGRTWYFVYHPGHTLFAVEDPLNQAENYYYNAEGDLAIRVDRSGAETFYNYLTDEKRRLASRNIPGDIDRIDYEYGPGAELKLTDGLSRVTKREFNAAGLLLKETDSLGNITRYEYDGARNLTKIIDARGKESIFTYDEKGNLLTSQDPLMRTSSFTYELVFNEVLSSTDGRGNTTYFRYDVEGNLTEIENPLSNVTVFFYDEFGNLTRSRDPLTHETAFTYTSQGLVETAADALGRTTRSVYDKRGNASQEIDPLGSYTLFSYDLLNRVTSVTDRVGVVTGFAYTPTGKMKTLTDHEGRVVMYNYDFAERLASRIYPDGSLEQFSYDKANNVIQTQDRSGVIINYEYDALDRLMKRIFPDNSTETFSYDELGRLRSASNLETGNFTFEYNDSSDLITESISKPAVRTLRFDYDSAGNRISRIDHKSRVTVFAYDPLNRMERITAADGTYEFRYDEASRLTKKILANGVTMDFSYDSADQLRSLVSRKASGQVLQEFGYDYDAVGSIRTKQSAIGMAEYEYDPAEQIIRENDPLAGVKPIVYDSLGNRVSSGSVNYATNLLNQYTQAASVSFTYDVAGRMETRTVPGIGTTVYRYDFLGRLKEVQKPDGTFVRYTYDPLGRRHSKQASRVTTYFLHDGDQVLAELDGRGNELRSYLWGPTVDELLSQTQRIGTYYMLHDHQYTITGLTDSAGNLIQSYIYDAFGNPTDGIKKKLTSYGYTGREYEAELNLYFYRNRFYDSTLGRFITPDPFLFVDGPNLYTYVGNNAVNYIDPYGLFLDDREKSRDRPEDPRKEPPYAPPPYTDPPYSPPPKGKFKPSFTKPKPIKPKPFKPKPLRFWV